MLTIRIIELIINSIIELKTVSVNIFNEESKFLIWKRLDADDLIGWSILRGMTLTEREDIIKMIDDDDKIITIPIDDEETDESYDALVTITSMKEQQDKIYYGATSLYDCCLFPDEKLNMMFELLNTPLKL